MRIHVLGIGGTFMGGVALLAQAQGHHVTGFDKNLYPPMSTQLQNQGIDIFEEEDPAQLIGVDCVIVGNVMKRGHPLMEAVLTQHLPYLSGPQWVAEHILRNRKVIAIAGTHGKTTTTSLVAWLLEAAGLKPGFLVGGVPENFGVSARLGESPYFVIEADEYDSAFFDKRSKFIHYRPEILILNNLEYDHADIFPDLAAIKQQFHYLVRTVPASGRIIYPETDSHLNDVLKMGSWTPLTTFGTKGEWQAHLDHADGHLFTVYLRGKKVAQVQWDLIGLHNVHNALAALAVMHALALDVTLACEALSQFKNVKRRLELKGKCRDIAIYDDFAHHPTAIATTLAGLRARVGHDARIIAVLEFGSYTMRAGVHKDRLIASLDAADWVICKNPPADWGLKDVIKGFTKPAHIYEDVDTIVSQLAPQLKAGDQVVVMSNSGFGNLHQKLLDAIQCN